LLFFFIAEYNSMLLMSALASLLFFGGWTVLPIFSFEVNSIISFALKILFILFLFIWIRATNPRYRYDQLMFLGWKVILPQSIAWVIFTAGFLLLLV